MNSFRATSAGVPMLACVSLLWTAHAAAAVEPSDDPEPQKSDSGRYEVQLKRVPTAGRGQVFYYVVTDLELKVPIAKVESSYQETPGELTGYSWSWAQAFSANWNARETKVAIDEASLHYGGTIIMVGLKGKDRGVVVNLPEDQVEAAVNIAWNRRRIRAWDMDDKATSLDPWDSDVLKVGVCGQAYVAAPHHYVHASYSVRIDFRDLNHPKILTLKPEFDGTSGDPKKLTGEKRPLTIAEWKAAVRHAPSVE